VVAERHGAAADFLGPPLWLRVATPDHHAFATARAARWPENRRAQVEAAPLLRRGRDASRTRLKLDPTTAPGDYKMILELANGKTREVFISVHPQARVRITPRGLNLSGPPGGAVSARLLIENRGNVGIDIGEALVTGIFDDDGIESALASAYRMDSNDLSAIAGNLFAHLREAHGGLLRLRVVEGRGLLAPGESRVLALQTTLASKLHRGHGYHGVLQIGQHGIGVRVRIDKAERNHHSEGVSS
jgi:hypothetical protein